MCVAIYSKTHFRNSIRLRDFTNYGVATLSSGIAYIDRSGLFLTLPLARGEIEGRVIEVNIDNDHWRCWPALIVARASLMPANDDRIDKEHGQLSTHTSLSSPWVAI